MNTIISTFLNALRAVIVWLVFIHVHNVPRIQQVPLPEDSEALLAHTAAGKLGQLSFHLSSFVSTGVCARGICYTFFFFKLFPSNLTTVMGALEKGNLF